MRHVELHAVDAYRRESWLARARRRRAGRRAQLRAVEPQHTSHAVSAVVVAGLVALSWLGVWALYRLAAWGLS